MDTVCSSTSSVTLQCKRYFSNKENGEILNGEVFRKVKSVPDFENWFLNFSL